MGLNVHRGWHITADRRSSPATGLWKASRHGVGMCAASYEDLVKMIDRRVHDEQEFVKRIAAKREAVDSSIGYRPSYIKPAMNCCHRSGPACWECPRRAPEVSNET